MSDFKTKLVEEFKDAAHELLLEGVIFATGVNEKGEVQYVHKAYATPEQRAYSAEFVKNLHKGKTEL